MRTVFELGCHDGVDTLKLAEAFPASVHAFECHPQMAAAARARCAAHPRIRIVERAVWDADGRIPFYPVVRTLEDDGREIQNPGASSCFRARDDYRRRYEQSETEVACTRLDTYCREQGLEGADLVCMDVQGAALHVLRGLGDCLGRTRYLIAELEHRPLYHGQDLLPQVDDFLLRAGFRQVVRVLRDDWFSDYFYVNLRLES